MKALTDIIDILGAENTEKLRNKLRLVQARAIDYRSDQRVEVVFNTKGFVRHINGTDNENGAVPKMYKAE